MHRREQRFSPTDGPGLPAGQVLVLPAGRPMSRSASLTVAEATSIP